MACLIPHRINDGAERDSIGALYAGGRSFASQKAWQAYLVRELRKVDGGMDGLNWMGDHYVDNAHCGVCLHGEWYECNRCAKTEIKEGVSHGA